MASSLPDVKSPGVHLVIATPEEHKEEWYLNSAEWQGPLSLEGYIRREQYLLDQDLTRDTGLTPWLLVHEPKDGEKRRILSACETFNKRALVAENGVVEAAVIVKWYSARVHADVYTRAVMHCVTWKNALSASKRV